MNPNLFKFVDPATGTTTVVNINAVRTVVPGSNIDRTTVTWLDGSTTTMVDVAHATCIRINAVAN